ncbi:MAG: TetR/AcrR family transcriptional regulator [Solirubrobacteraceae bacterium]|nr:TetR/AcrR family transcriptional regulator [Solirubrobacteraceae bacterium]
MPAPRMNADERRNQLLDILCDVVLSEGFAAVSIDRIARDANIARTVIYSHFGNLDGMLEALIDRTTDRAMSQVRSVVPDFPLSAEPAEVLADAIGTFTTMVRTDPVTWRIVLLPADGAPAQLRERMVSARDAIQTLLAPLVEWGIGAMGVVDLNLDVELLAHSIVLLGEDGARLTLTDPERYPPERLQAFAGSLVAAVTRS